MQANLTFRGKKYLVNIDVSKNFGETNYLVYVYFENSIVKKVHFLYTMKEITAVLSSSNHNLRPTEHDNELLYALKAMLFKDGHKLRCRKSKLLG